MEFESTPDLETFPKIEYMDERVTVSMEDILNSNEKVLADRMVDGLWQRKSKGWDYEEEYRQYITLDACESAGGMYFARLRPESLRRVLLGWRSEIEVETMRELLHHSGYTNCPVVRGRPARTSYAVEF